MKLRSRPALAIATAMACAACSAGSPAGRPASSPTRPPTAPSARPGSPPITVASLSGRITFSRDGGDVYVAAADGTKVRRLTTKRGPEFDPSWSPDGTRIAYRDSTHGINHNDEIYAMNADGSHHRNLTRNPADDWGPAWSPDGSLIAFNTARDLMPEIYVMRPDGSHVRRLTEIEGEYPAWSPDGTGIAFMSMRPGASGNDPNYDVFVMNSDGTGLRRLTTWSGEDGWPAWSPDGRTIAYTTTQDNHWQTGDVGPFFDIWVMAADGSGKHRLAGIYGMFPVWSPDGGYVMFSGSRLPLSSEDLWVVRPDGTGLARGLANASMPDWIQT